MSPTSEKILRKSLVEIKNRYKDIIGNICEHLDMNFVLGNVVVQILIFLYVKSGDENNGFNIYIYIYGEIFRGKASKSINFMFK